MQIYIQRARKVKCVHFIGLFNLYTVNESSFRIRLRAISETVFQFNVYRYESISLLGMQR